VGAKQLGTFGFFGCKFKKTLQSLMKIIEKKSSYPKKKKKKKNTSCRFFIIGNFNIFSHLKKISINIFLVVVSSFYKPYMWSF
jgi:hypothetical protein